MRYFFITQDKNLPGSIQYRDFDINGNGPIILPIIRSLYWGWDGNSHMPAGYIGIQGMWSIPGFIWRPSRVILCATRSRMAVG